MVVRLPQTRINEAEPVFTIDPTTGLPASISGSAGGTANAAAPTYIEGATGQPLSLDLHGAERILPMSPTGVAIDLSAGTAGSPAGGVSSVQGVAGMTPVATNLAAAATGGSTLSGTQCTASTNATSVKASAGVLHGGQAINTTGTIYYLRFYNLATAPTPSSATGFVLTVPVPANTTGAGVLLNFGPFGGAFGTGIAFCVTGGPTSTDNSNAAAGVFVNLAYQ